MCCFFFFFLVVSANYVFELKSKNTVTLCSTDNKSFFVLSMSDSGAQIYELMAQTVSEQRT